ncbi:MAG: hypothetical protein ABH846_03430 [Patescibacteria group bacterium]
MQEKNLRRLMRLSKRAGVPLIVSDGEEDFVLLGVDQFEALIEAEDADFEDLSDEYFDEDKVGVPPLEVYEADGQGEQEVHFHEGNDDEEADIHSSMQHRAAPIELEEEARLPNVSSAVPENVTDEEEERFYLEPID